MLERLKELSELYGVSGNETRVRACLRAAAAPYADELFTDPVGNLYAHRRGSGPRVMLAAHMDEVGMIVREITEAGTLLYEAAGLDPRVVVSKRVAIGPNDVPGVIGAKAIHLQSPEERTRALKHTDLYVDIGAKDRADAEKYVSRGDYISFTTKFSAFGEGLVRGKALDDRVGCAIVLELFKNSYDCDLWAVFTVQEEVGCRGSKPAAYAIAPDYAIAVDVTNTGDRAGAEVVQLYIGDEQSSLPRPVKELKGFQKVSLNPGQTRTVTFEITPGMLQYYDDAKGAWVAEPGAFTAYVGAASDDIRGTVEFELK